VYNGYNPDNATNSDRADARDLLKGKRFKIDKSVRNNLSNKSIHLTEISNEFQTWDNSRKSRGVENLSFQEWTEKYHQ